MRKTDTEEKVFFRSDERFYCEDGQWYFQTREGDRGPFKSRLVAELKLRHYIDSMAFLEDRNESQSSDIDWADVTIADVDE